jgi:rhodopsin domain-containing protein
MCQSTRQVLSLIQSGLIIAVHIYTHRSHPANLTTVLHLSFATVPVTNWMLAWIKISVCLLLLRIKYTWRYAMWTIIVVQLSAATASNIVMLIQCKPIAANWNQTIPGAKCWPFSKAKLTIYCFSGQLPYILSHNISIPLINIA